jgi:hypothetical protein
LRFTHDGCYGNFIILIMGFMNQLYNLNLRGHHLAKF